MLRKRGGDLPTFTSNQPSVPDGSGKSIKMEAPLVKAIRSASGFTKWTYGWLFISLFFGWSGWTWIRRNSASIILDCHVTGCTITIQPPNNFIPRNSSENKRKRKIKIEIQRDQFVRADNIKWDPIAQRIVENYGANSPTYASQQVNQDEDESKPESNRPTKQWKKHTKYQKKKGGNKAPAYRAGSPDADGNYDSYIIILRDPLPSTPTSSSENNEQDNESPSKKMQREMQAQHKSMTHDPNSLASLLAPFAIQDDDSQSRRRINSDEDSNNDNNFLVNTEYILHTRDFNIGQTRRLARTAVSKINAYTKGRRTNFVLRESRPVAWQGLVLLILGIFSFVLCLLLGQFYEDSDPTKDGSYRKRMAELKKRNEAMQKRRTRNVGAKPVVRAMNSTRAGQVGGAVLKSAMGGSSSRGNTRMRVNASGAGSSGRGY